MRLPSSRPSRSAPAQRPRTRAVRRAAAPNRAFLRRRVRLWLGGAALAAVVVSGLALVATATPGMAEEQAIAVDRQAYVPDAGPDAYEANAASGGDCTMAPCPPDPIDLHVGAAPNQPTYHSLLRVELDAIPADDTVSSLVVTLVVTTDTAQDNVNVNEAILDAYPLAQELPAEFTGCAASAGCDAPAVDTKGPEVVGKAGHDDQGHLTSFSFDVGPMLPYWQAKGVNTGFAVVPAAGATTQPWTVGFTRTLVTATATAQSPGGGVTVIPPAPPAPPAPAQSAVAPAAPVVAAPVTIPSAGATAAPEASPSAAAAPAATPPTVVVQAAAPGQLPAWLLVFGISLAFAVALLAQPMVQALSSAAGPRAGMLTQLHLHPRMVAVAATLLVWSSGWGVYTHTTGTGASTPVASTTNPHAPVAGIPSYAPATQAPGPTGSASSSAGGTATSSGSGASSRSGGSGGGAPVGAEAFTGSSPVAPRARLYPPSQDNVGITDTTIQMCVHAALTFGAEFNIAPKDLNVFWQMVNDRNADPYPHTAGQAGIYNRKVVQPDGSDGIAVQDDGYQPSKAVQAAQNCADQPGGDFFLLSGIGFDQIPAVRVWAEQNHVLYVHHIATQAGTAGLQYSFTMLPSLEQVGTQFGEYYLSHLEGQKIGIIERNSSNWEPGVVTFKAALKAAGQSGNIVADDKVTNNQGDYTKEIVDMKSAGAQTVFIWENALAADEIIQQASNQAWNPPPKWLLFPFNLTLYTLNASGVDTSGMQGIVPWPAYTSASTRCNPSGSQGGSGITRNDADYQQYLGEIRQFEAAYDKWDPTANLCGDGGDLLFGTWEAWRQVADLLVKCGVACSRNAVAGLMLDGYSSQVGANCTVDFSRGDHHHGGGGEDIYVVKQEHGGPGWVNTGYCEAKIE